MAGLVYLLVLHIVISAVGIAGNLLLLGSLMRLPRLKTYEIFLLGLASTNLEEIVVVDVYDVVVLQLSQMRLVNVWWCRTLKFLTVLGEIGSISFTVLISVFRYQKLRDAERRVSRPIRMDDRRVAYALCGGSLLLALALATPTYVTNLDGHLVNLSQPGGCPPDFFQCHPDNCPLLNRLYKYLFIVLVNLLPLLVVSYSSGLILRVLLRQHRAVQARLATQGHVGSRSGRTTFRFRNSTVTILVAMVVFQVNWSLYLVLHLASSPYSFHAWSEVEFFITTSYTTISPYVYGIGSDLFAIRSCKG
ncbi:uncharacterized protein LOC134468775 [Engraulis encrasicolus]|uniref:uncharacterized protein LOC134468775 n=1 Tax=Engraulis encrasicolus TaxID=184585 RepID=UPI002FCF91E6